MDQPRGSCEPVNRLKAIDEHNDQRRRERKEREEAALKTGVACPKCGKELRWHTGVFFQVSVFPPPTTQPAECKECGITVSLEK